MARTVRGVRQTLPPGSLVGRISGSGAAQVITLQDVATALNGSGLIAAPPAAGGTPTTTVAAGTGISVSLSGSAYTVSNSGVTSAIAGPGIAVSGATGAVTFTNTGGSLAPVAVCATAALAANTYVNNAGVGSTLTGNANGALVVDGITAAAGGVLDVGLAVLVTAEASPAHNGVYLVTQDGDASHPYILTRRSDFNQNYTPATGTEIGVSAGTVNAHTIFQFTGGNFTSSPTIGTSTLLFQRTGFGGGAGGLFSPAMSDTPTNASLGFTTWVNQGSATAADNAVGYTITQPAAGANDHWALRTFAAPSTPYTITALVAVSYQGGSIGGALLGFYDGTNKFQGIRLICNSAQYQTFVTNYSTPTAFSANVIGPGGGGPQMWLRISDDGTTATYSVSADGINFSPLSAITESGSFLGAGNFKNVCFGVEANAQTCYGTIMSWKQT